MYTFTAKYISSNALSICDDQNERMNMYYNQILVEKSNMDMELIMTLFDIIPIVIFVTITVYERIFGQ